MLYGKCVRFKCLCDCVCVLCLLPQLQLHTLFTFCCAAKKRLADSRSADRTDEFHFSTPMLSRENVVFVSVGRYKYAAPLAY